MLVVSKTKQMSFLSHIFIANTYTHITSRLLTRDAFLVCSVLSPHGRICFLNFFSKIRFLVLSSHIVVTYYYYYYYSRWLRLCEGGHIQTHIVHTRKKNAFSRGKWENFNYIRRKKNTVPRCSLKHKCSYVCMSISSSRLFQTRKEESPSTRHAIYIRIVTLKCHSIFYQ